MCEVAGLQPCHLSGELPGMLPRSRLAYTHGTTMWYTPIQLWLPHWPECSSLWQCSSAVTLKVC